MTEDLREKYQSEVRRLAAERAALRPKRTLRQRLADLLGRQPKAVDVAPRHRISGPRLVPENWHSEAGQDAMPPAVFGPRCHECGERVFASEDTLHGLAGLCGLCFGRLNGSPMPELKPYGDDGHEPPRAA